MNREEIRRRADAHRSRAYGQDGPTTVKRARPPTEIIRHGEPCPGAEAWYRKPVASMVSYARVKCSRDVPLAVLEARNAHCQVCRFATEIRTPDGVDLFCGCCGCPMAAGSSLIRAKNPKAAWKCPGPHRAFGPWVPPDVGPPEGSPHHP